VSDDGRLLVAVRDGAGRYGNDGRQHSAGQDHYWKFGSHGVSQAAPDEDRLSFDQP
jgi:hypothetical protein